MYDENNYNFAASRNVIKLVCIDWKGLYWYSELCLLTVHVEGGHICDIECNE
jgi:hypothetical protein